jgi:hypothetical protein
MFNYSSVFFHLIYIIHTKKQCYRARAAAASFWWSRSLNAMRLHLRLRRRQTYYATISNNCFLVLFIFVTILIMKNLSKKKPLPGAEAA